jgi:hypothetical protein
MSAATLTFIKASSMAMNTTHLGLAKLASDTLKTMFRNKTSDRELLYKAVFGSYALVLMLLTLRDHSYFPKDQSISNEAVHPVRQRSSTWSVSAPTKSWFSIASTIGRARSASMPIPRARSSSITGDAVAGRRMSVST